MKSSWFAPCFNSRLLCSISTGDPSIATRMSREVLGVFSKPKRGKLSDLCGGLLTLGTISLGTSASCAANRYCVATLCSHCKIICASGECCHGIDSGNVQGTFAHLSPAAIVMTLRMFRTHSIEFAAVRARSWHRYSGIRRQLRRDPPSSIPHESNPSFNLTNKISQSSSLFFLAAHACHDKDK